MSSLNATILSELQAIRGEMLTLKLSVSSLEERLAAQPSAVKTKTSSSSEAAPAPAPAKKEKKAKDPSAPKRPPTAWRLFADRVRSVLREAGFDGSSLGTECVQFASSLKEENADFSSWTESDILARRAAWSKPEISKQAAAKPKSTGSAAASVDGDGAAAPASVEAPKKARKNPWADLTPEQKAERVAKLKAGKAAKKAAAGDDEEEAPASDGEAAPSVTSSEKKKRGPKKFSEMTPEELADAKAKRAAKKEAKSAEAPKASEGVAAVSNAAPLPPLPASPASSVDHSLGGFQRVMLAGSPFWVNLITGHAYHRLAGNLQGEWAGIFHKTPKPHIDDSVPEPVFTNLDELD